MITPALLAQPLNRLAAESAVADAGNILRDELTIAPVMPSLRDPASPLPACSVSIRPDVLDERQPHATRASARFDEWLAGRSGDPLIYFTLGTIFHQESGDLFPRVLRGLSALPANIVVTVGHEVDPAELGAHGDNVLIERYLPQRAILPRASLVVSHGGSGTVVSALACGVPLVLLPLGADQPWNADRCRALGVATVLDPLTVSPVDAADVVANTLARREYRVAAGALRREAESLPTADVAADAVEQLLR